MNYGVVGSLRCGVRRSNVRGENSMLFLVCARGVDDERCDCCAMWRKGHDFIGAMRETKERERKRVYSQRSLV